MECRSSGWAKYTHLLRRGIITVLLAQIQLICYVKIINRFTCFVEFKPEANHTAGTLPLPHEVSILGWGPHLFFTLIALRRTVEAASSAVENLVRRICRRWWSRARWTGRTGRPSSPCSWDLRPEHSFLTTKKILEVYDRSIRSFVRYSFVVAIFVNFVAD